MPLLLDDIKYNKLYNRQVMLPINKKNRKKGSLVYLMTPAIEESIRLMNAYQNRYFLNNGNYSAYYVEKDINLIINEGVVSNIDRDIMLTEVTLSKYARLNITDPKEFMDLTGETMEPSSIAIVFLNTEAGNKPVGYIVLMGTICTNMNTISKPLDREMVAFAVDVLKVTSCHARVADKYKKIFKDEYEFHYLGNTSTGVMVKPLSENVEPFYRVITESGSMRLQAEIALWKAQIAISETIIKNWDDESWMKKNYKSMKAKLSRIPIKGFSNRIDDSVDDIKDHLACQKATLSFMMSVSEIELKDEYDLSDITGSYTSWIKSLKCSRSFKLKAVRELKKSYQDTIKLYESNLKRYRKQNEAQKRVENVKAIITKTISLFTIFQGPMAILQDMALNSILPKSRKTNVLSETELEAKIKQYQAIVDKLQDLERELEVEEALNESTLIEAKIDNKENIPEDIKELNKQLNGYDYGVWYSGEKFDAKDFDFRLYHTLTIREFEAHKVGVCWDFTHYEADWFKKHKYKYETYFIYIEGKEMDTPNHTFLVFSLDGDSKVYWFESSWGKYTGIRAFNNTKELLDFICAKHKESYGDSSDIVKVKKYDAASTAYENLSTTEFINKVEPKINASFDESAVFTEAILSSKERKGLKDSDYGLPNQRKFPMPDASHVKAAVRMFNHVDPKYEKDLANAITRKAKEFGIEDEISVGSKNRYSKYCPSSMLEYMPVGSITESSSISKDLYDHYEDNITFYESVLNEDASYNATLKRILYSERLRNNKEVLDHYNTIKAQCPFIDKTYLELKKYKSFNMFVDLGYYINSFIKNNTYKLNRGLDLYIEFLSRLLEDKRYRQAGYNNHVVFVPVDCWEIEQDTDLWDYKYNLNPISIIYHSIFSGSIGKLDRFKGVDFVFIAHNGFFKCDISKLDKKVLFKFRENISKLLEGSVIDNTDEPSSSVDGITADVLSRISKLDSTTNSGVDINNVEVKDTVAHNRLIGGSGEVSKEDLEKKIADAEADNEADGVVEDKEKLAKRIENEEKLKAKVADAAASADNTEDALAKLDRDEEFKQILADLKMSSNNTVDYSPTRKARIDDLNKKYLQKSYRDTTIGDILYDEQAFQPPIKKTSIPVDSTNEEWQHLQGANLADSYDVTADIYRILYHFGSCTIPVAVRDVAIVNASTSEDSIDTWTVQCEDINGKRFTLKIDIPRIINKRFMKLRGNEKIMGNQLMNLPIIKTDRYTCQITTNYNKIFISPSTAISGKSYVTADRLNKALSKYNGKGITIMEGDNSIVNRKYELPIDYLDLSSNYTMIETDKSVYPYYKFYFNQEELLNEYRDKIDKEKFAIGIMKYSAKEPIKIIYCINAPASEQIAMTLTANNSSFKEVYEATSVSSKYAYSIASIMSSKIPLAVVLGYAIGMTPMLDRAGIDYQIVDKRPKYDKSTSDIIKFNDGYILYTLNYDSSMLLNGLKGCPTEAYSIKEMNAKAMWLDFLDLFGGRIKSDGLDMFYDLMFDPISKSVCDKYKLPNNYVDALLYANMLMSDNKYNKHTDIKGNRYRNNEIIAAYTYKALATSYSTYRRSLKIGREVPMTIKQSAVIDLIMADNTQSDYSSLSPLLEFESANATSFKGLSGMNAERSYSLDKRTYDESMLNVLAMSTGFANTAGVNRQSVIDPNIDTVRGYIKGNPDKMSVTKTLCMTEALTPYGVTSDDSFRTAMTFIQTSKHQMRTTIGDPSLVTTGADEALVYLTSDTFSFKAKGKGKIIEKTDDYLVIEYDNPVRDNGEKCEVVDLREKMVKNSDGGFYQSLKLDTDYKVGDRVKEMDVVAVDKLSYNDDVGPRDNYAYNLGTFCKFCVMMSDEGFEDSCRSTHWLAKAMSSTVITEQEYSFDKDTNIYYLVKKGQEVQEGEPILIFQSAFEDEDANALVRALKADDEDIVEEIGRITLKSKVTGVVKDIKVRRCCEIEECSPTMQKVIKDYNKSVADINKVYEKYDKDKAKEADPTYALPATGKLKNTEDGVLISIYIAYQDDFGVSDKTVCYSALKGVSSKEIIPEGEEAFSTYRPDEKIHYIQGDIGVMKRMVGSVFKIGALNKVLVELHRHMADIMGIKWYYYDDPRWDKK